MNEILQVPCVDRSGEHVYSIRVLHEFGAGDGYLDAQKVSQLWNAARQHDVLFSDYTAGRVEPFLQVLMNPASVWLEIFRTTDEVPIGVAYITNVIPNFDAKGHFAFWDSIGGGREPIVWAIMDWMFDRYNLRRITAELPPYQAGTIRFTKKVGFTQEGVRRESVLHKGKWMPLILFGITRGEFEKIFDDALAEEVKVG